MLVCGIETCIKSGGGMRGCLGGGCVVCWRQVGIPGQQRGFIITLMVPIIKRSSGKNPMPSTVRRPGKKKENKKLGRLRAKQY